MGLPQTEPICPRIPARDGGKVLPVSHVRSTARRLGELIVPYLAEAAHATRERPQFSRIRDHSESP